MLIIPLNHNIIPSQNESNVIYDKVLIPWNVNNTHHLLL